MAEPDPCAKPGKIKASGAGQLLALQVWSCGWILPPSTEQGGRHAGQSPRAEPGAAAVGTGGLPALSVAGRTQPQLTPRLSVHPGGSSGPDTPGAKRPSRQPTHTCSRATFRDTCTPWAQLPGAPGAVPRRPIARAGDTHTQALARH